MCSTGEKTDKVLHGHLIASVVYLNIVSVDIDMLISVIENGARTWVSGIASHIVGHHQYDLTVRDAQSFHRSIDGQDVGHMTIVEPETGCIDQNRPIVCMTAGILNKMVWELKFNVISKGIDTFDHYLRFHAKNSCHEPHNREEIGRKEKSETFLTRLYVWR